MISKKALGQFYTTNYEYILEGFSIPPNSKVVEPFVGQGDLLKWIGPDHSVEVYDIDPKIDAITRDTLVDPPDYKGKFVITNPPYLAKNKNKDKTIYNKYVVDDLYKGFLKSLVEGSVEGGIVIVPLNFISDRDRKIRNTFFQDYHITKIKIFEETVFRDTSYTVCAFQFAEKKTSKYKIGRLLSGGVPSSDLFLYAIDTGTNGGRIRLDIRKQHWYGNHTDRAFATITTNVPIEDEQLVVEMFNKQLESRRNQYHSLFLTNYRNSTKSYARKRISFDMCYNMIKDILKEITNVSD